jgi:hypothetical protein
MMDQDPKDTAEQAVDDVEDFLDPDDERPAGQDMPADAVPDPEDDRPR